MDNNIKAILAQAAQGEFGIYKKQAACMTPHEFAKLHDSKVKPWGRGGCYDGVEVDGTTYLWREGEYDGWDKPM